MPTTFGAHAFIWAGDWTPGGARRVIEGAASAGLDFIEIPLLHPDTFDVQETKAMLGANGLTAYTSLGLPKDCHLPAHPDKAEAFLKRAVDVTAELGAPALSGAVYTHLGTLTSAPPTTEELDAVVRVLKIIASYAAEREIQLGIEAINRYETYLCNLASQAVDLTQRIDEPNVFVHLDTYHMNIEEKGFYDSIVQTGSHLQYIHLSESDRGIPGTANVHWDDVFRGLRDINYQGPLVMESFAAINPDIAGATALWRDVVGDAQRLVTEGLEFLRSKAREYEVLTS
jgi:D-psicose/D-tagatose/L-ribulose 3-epimerase